jgi:TatD DNase family protein
MQVSYVDVHTHLTHEDFRNDWQSVIQKAESAGVCAIVVNGLEPISNRLILEWAKSWPVILPALGIYPLDAVNDIIPAGFPFEVPRFSVEEEIQFIEKMAREGRLAAIGECGLDAHYLDVSFLPAQEAVFRRLIEIARIYDLPLIIHTRRAEARAGEILTEHKIEKVNFHCFGGKTSLAKKYAETYGWWFSIPAHCRISQAFQKMMRILPPEKILTETDAPYLSPVRGTRNEPANVVGTIDLLASFRGWSHEQAKIQVWNNFQALFKKT